LPTASAGHTVSCISLVPLHRARELPERGANPRPAEGAGPLPTLASLQPRPLP
jgi:hypothetical protein